MQRKAKEQKEEIRNMQYLSIRETGQGLKLIKTQEAREGDVLQRLVRSEIKSQANSEARTASAKVLRAAASSAGSRIAKRPE